jgi:TrmH family RNA methyltransferase
MGAHIRVIAVSPKYQANLGYIARVMKNFGLSDLAVVSPRCNPTGKQAIKYSKHAVGILMGARTYKSLAAARRGFMVGTTGLWRKSEAAFYGIYELSSLRGSKGWARSRRLSIVLGREDTGLTKGELAACDAIVFIGANGEYPVLNISHALAVLLYELTMPAFSKDYAFMRSFPASEKHVERLLGLFDSLVKKRPNIRDRRAVSGAFRRVIRRSMPTEKEVNAISAALSPRHKEQRDRE